MEKRAMSKIFKSVFFGFVISARVYASDPAQTQYSDVKTFLQNLSATHPQTTRLIHVGASDSGDEILGVALGSGAIHNLVVATHHGNEYGSTEVARAFAQSLAENPISHQTVFVIPVLNVTGYNSKQRHEYDANQKFFDSNRNYPSPCGTEGPFTLKSTAALANFIDKENIVASATLHTFYPAVVYPWGLSTPDLATHYEEQFKLLAGWATEESHYPKGNSTDVIYAANGTFEDYAFWQHGIWSMLFELGHSHNPTRADIDEMVKVNIPGLRRMLAQAPVVRAAEHKFTGKCDGRLAIFDRHDE